MEARRIDGNAVAIEVRGEIAARVRTLSNMGIVPGLAVILVGDDAASEVYVNKKVEACQQAGINSMLERHAAGLAESALLARIAVLNADPAVHGILVQLPLPRHISSAKVIAAIAPAKDVDGFSATNAGALIIGTPGFLSCTPYGCMKLLDSTGVDLEGKHAVVVGRSNNVGKPMALMLLQRNATVTICHSATRDLALHTRQADIVVVAVGRRNTLTGNMVKPGAVVIDVGMNRDERGKLCGDVDFDGVNKVAGWITPVPGGVGPMTVTMLLMNTLEEAERQARTRSVADRCAGSESRQNPVGS